MLEVVLLDVVVDNVLDDTDELLVVVELVVVELELTVVTLELVLVVELVTVLSVTVVVDAVEVDELVVVDELTVVELSVVVLELAELLVVVVGMELVVVLLLVVLGVLLLLVVVVVATRDDGRPQPQCDPQRDPARADQSESECLPDGGTRRLACGGHLRRLGWQRRDRRCHHALRAREVGPGKRGALHHSGHAAPGAGQPPRALRG